MKSSRFRLACPALALTVLLSGCARFGYADAARTATSYGTRVINGRTYSLTFADDFDGDRLDTRLWSICPAWTRGDETVSARWDSRMVSVRDGSLIIDAKTDDEGTILCGGVRTIHTFTQRKGYFECRCKLPVSAGCIGAFWLLDPHMGSSSGDGAKNGVEIDILESLAAYGEINHALHWDGYKEDHQGTGKRVFMPKLFDGNFHTFACEWTDEAYVFYVDGQETWRCTDVESCENEVYLKVTVEFGSWAGVPDKRILSAQFVVDYVRVWQC